MKAYFYAQFQCADCGLLMEKHDPRFCVCEDEGTFIACNNRECKNYGVKFLVPSIELSRLA